ncbi:MAG: heat shock protein HslJ [Flavobacteriales bacterium]|jgi:heat shock protein HslJ
MTIKTLLASLFLISILSCKTSDIPAQTPETLLWEIAETKVPCEGVSSQECFQIRPQGTTDWTLFYDTITGFEYLEGYAYTLKIQATPILNPPADASSVSYKLITIVSQRNTSKVVNGVPLLDGNFEVTTVNGKDVSVHHLTISLDAPRKKITGFSGCNNYNVGVHQKGFQLRFSQVGTTKKYCADTASLEKEFLITYIQGDHFSLDGDLLKIYDLDNQILEARRVL